MRAAMRLSPILLLLIAAMSVMVIDAQARCPRVRIGAVCRDGTHSSATGSGACSWHDGVAYWLYRDPNPTVDLGSDRNLICEASSIVIEASVTGGSLPYSYSWSPGGETTESISVSSPGEYTLTVTGRDGCSGQDTVLVIASELRLAIDAEPARSLSCSVASVVLNASVSGGVPPYTYLWAPGMQVTEQIEVAQAGTYTLTVTDTHGCSSTDSVVVSDERAAPVVDAGPDEHLSCTVLMVTLDASVTDGSPPYTYAWHPGGQTTEDIAVMTPGEYTLTVTGADGCSSQDTVLVIADELRLAIDAEPARSLSCSVASVMLNASVSGGVPPYTYLWAPGMQVTQQIEVAEAGTYTVTVTDTHGCSSTDGVVVSDERTAPVVHAGPDELLSCTVLVVTLDASVTDGIPPYTYAWHPGGQTTEDITVMTPGEYTLTVTGADGCSATDTVTVLDGRTLPVVDAGPDVTLTCAENTAILRPAVSGGTLPYTFQWSPSGETTEEISVSEPGTYVLTVIEAGGCMGQDSVLVAEDRTTPIVRAGQDQILSRASPSIILSARVHGGSPPYTYTWAPDGQTTEDIHVGKPGIYTVTVTGANGCSASDDVAVTQRASSCFVFGIGGAVLVCSALTVAVIWRRRRGSRTIWLSPRR